MKTIQMTIEPLLLKDVDHTVEQLAVSRSAFIRDALRKAVREHKIRLMDEQHRRGYEKVPQQLDKLQEIIDAQAWPDDEDEWSEYYVER